MQGARTYCGLLRVNSRVIGDHVQLLEFLSARGLRLIGLIRAIRSARVLTVQSHLAARTENVNNRLRQRVTISRGRVPMSINREGFDYEGGVVIIDYYIMRLTLLIEGLTYARTEDLVSRCEQLGLGMTIDHVLVGRMISRNSLRSHALAFVCERTHANGLSSRIGISSIVFLHGIPIERNVYTRFESFVSRLRRCVILDPLSFESRVAECVQGRGRRQIRFNVILL